MSLPELPPPTDELLKYPPSERMSAYATAYALACVEAERERCAKICETLGDAYDGENCAAAIRSQGKTE